MQWWYPWSVYRDIVWLFIKQRLLGRGTTRRDQAFIIRDYEEVWSESAVANIVGRRPKVFTLFGKPGLYRSIDYRKFFIEHIHQTVTSFQPKTILELGSGIGINLLVLAVLYPGAKRLVGVELTEEGIKTSQAILKDPPIEELIYMTELDEETVRKRLKTASIQFVQGDMLALPFADRSFDFSFSRLVFEQLPRTYLTAFREAKRVTDGHILFLEEFREVQNMFQKLHLFNVDYFRASFLEVQKVGLTVLKFEPMQFSKIKLSAASLLCSTTKNK